MGARYIRRGVSKFYFLPTVAGYTSAGTGAPTSGELSGGTDLTGQIAGVDGWQLTVNQVATPDMATDFDSSIPGTKAADASSFDFYEDDTTATIETLLPTGTSGYIYIQRKGAGTAKTKSCDLFPVRVGSKTPMYSADNEPAKFKVTFTVTSKPSLDTAPPV